MIYTYPDTMQTLKAYVTDVLNSFKNDGRILMWDLYNEPGNNRQFEKSFPLLKNVFQWARQINPTQPVTVGVWNNASEFQNLNKFQLENSDVITYHDYKYIDQHIRTTDTLQRYGRPLICTEYMARSNGSLFQLIMPMLKEKNIGAINWGFESGKTNTIHAWNTPVSTGQEPILWFHDIYREDQTPFSETEIRFIKTICSEPTKNKKMQTE